MTACSVVLIEKSVMLRALSEQPTVAETFIAHLIDRHRHYEEDLIDHLFNPVEKRLARVLYVLSNSCEDEQERIVPKVSQETLAEMVGATRPRVNYFMNKFRDLGLIDYQNGIRLHRSFLEMVSREQLEGPNQLDHSPLVARFPSIAVSRSLAVRRAAKP
jgi:CRP-like cAMP-binding protein